MTLYTKLNDEIINQLITQFDVGIVQDWKILHGGAENTNHYLKTNKGQYVLTICERKTVAETTALAKLLKHLEQHQFDTTKIIPNQKGTLLSFYQDKPILLKSYIEGRVEENIANDLLIKIGNSIAQLHLIPAPAYLPKEYSYGQQAFPQLTEQRINHPFVEWLNNQHQNILGKLHSDLPKAFIHGDVFDSNVVISANETPIIMDFEEACYYYRIYDLGMAIVGLCQENGLINWAKANLLIQGYQSTIALIPLERNYLKDFIIYAATATAFWRFRQFNILAPMEAYKNTYQAMLNIAEQTKNTSFSFFAQ